MMIIDVESIFGDCDVKPDEYLDMLFDRCREGVLAIARYDFDRTASIPAVYDYYEMKWNEEDRDCVKADFDCLCSKLFKIAAKGYSDRAVEEAVNEIIESPDYFVTACAKRMCRLRSLKAPNVIIRNECRELILSMATNRFSIDTNRVDDPCGELIYAIYGDRYEVPDDRQEDFEDAVDSMLFKLSKEERNNLLSVLFADELAYGAYRDTLRKLRCSPWAKTIRNILRSSRGCNDMDYSNLETAMKECFAHEEMYRHVTEVLRMMDPDACEHYVSTIIGGAPINLNRKKELFEMLGYSEYAKIVENALNEMEAKPGECIIGTAYHLSLYDYDIVNLGYLPVKNAKDAAGLSYVFYGIDDGCESEEEYARKAYQYDMDDCCWNHAKKYLLTDTGRYVEHVSFKSVGKEVCWFCYKDRKDSLKRWKGDLKKRKFESNAFMDIPAPFKGGDLVEVDCRPFSPVKHVLITGDYGLNSINDYECIHAKGEGQYEEVPFNHEFMWDMGWLEMSPFYRARTVSENELSDEEKGLVEIRNAALKQIEEKGLTWRDVGKMEFGDYSVK